MDSFNDLSNKELLKKNLFDKIRKFLSEKDAVVFIKEKRGVSSFAGVDGWQEHKYNGSKTFILQIDISGGAYDE